MIITFFFFLLNQFYKGYASYPSLKMCCGWFFFKIKMGENISSREEK